MARPKNPVPTYRFHKSSGNAYADFYDPLTGVRRSVCLGRWGSAESRAEHARVCAEVAAGTARTPAADVTVSEVLLHFWKHAQDHYVRADGTKTNETEEYRAVIKVLRELYAPTPAAAFGVLELRTVIDAMVKAGWTRGTVNNRLRRVKHLFKWAAANALVPASVHHTLQVVPGLQRGRTMAPEGKGRTAVPEAVVRAVLPFVRPAVAAMLELQLLTGMRPGEVCQLRPCDLDAAGDVWRFVPPQHKNLHRGKPRVVIGPKGQELLRRFRPESDDGHYFSPAREVGRQNAERSERRVTPLYPSHRKRNAAKRSKAPSRPPRAFYVAGSYGVAVKRGIERANADLRGRGEPPLPAFTPHMIRHQHGAKVREAFGSLEHVRATLGQSSASMADHYSRSADEKLAAEVAKKIG